MRRAPDMGATLSHADTRALYDRIGAWLDTQRFYEDAAVTELFAHSALDSARSVLEFGAGTGRVAARLLQDHLPEGGRYHGVDSSATMVGLARARLERWRDRATVALTDGAPRLEVAPGAFDRFLSTYVLDLLSAADIGAVLAEAHRLLAPHGRLCLVSATHGRTALERLVMGAAGGIHRRAPHLVGGCRAIDLASFLAPERWRLTHHQVISKWGIPSEIVVCVRTGEAS